MNKTLAIIYARVSSSGSLEYRQNTDRQVKDLQEYSTYKGFDNKEVTATLDRTIRFIEEKGFNNGYNKKLYVRDDNGKLRPIKALTTFNKRANTTVAVMELGDSIFKLQSPPRMDEFTRRKRGLDLINDLLDSPF